MNPFGVILVVATTLFPAYQLFSLPNVADQVALFSQYLGLAALILMAWGQILATRVAGIEAPESAPKPLGSAQPTPDIAKTTPPDRPHSAG